MNTSNFINLIGHVGQDPKRKNFESGGSLLEFSLATNSYYKDREGNRVQETEWHLVKCFSPLVDVLERYVKKGDQLSVVGSMKYQKWTDKYEQKRQTAEVHLDSFSFIGNNNRGEVNQSSQTTPNKPSNPDSQSKPSFAGEFGDPKSVPKADAKHIPF